MKSVRCLRCDAIINELPEDGCCPECGRKALEKPKDARAAYIGKNFFTDAVLLDSGVKFMVYHADGKKEFRDYIYSDDGALIVPLRAENNAFIKLPRAASAIFPTEREDLLALYEDVRRAINGLFDAGADLQLDLMTLWVFASYNFDRLGVGPYLRFCGPFGTGKTRALNTVGHLSLRPLNIGPALTEAACFRLCEAYAPTVCLNEFDERMKGDYTTLAVQLLNSRYERGHPIPRVGKDGRDKFTLEFFDPYGPTAFSARGPFSDASLESRVLEITCSESEREDIRARTILSPEMFEQELGPLRDRLYIALRYFNEPIPAGCCPFADGMPGRFRQSLTALWAALPEVLRPKLEALSGELKMRELAKFENSDEGQVWQAILEAAEDAQKEGRELKLTGAMVGEALGETDQKKASRSGGRRLKAMGFYPEKHQRERLWKCKERLWTKHARRLGYSVAYPWSTAQETLGGVNERDGGVSVALSTVENGVISINSGGREAEKGASSPENNASNATTVETKRHENATDNAITPRKVRLSQDLPAWVGLDGQTYGPFTKDQEVSLPGPEAQRLIRKGLAQEVAL